MPCDDAPSFIPTSVDVRYHTRDTCRSDIDGLIPGQTEVGRSREILLVEGARGRAHGGGGAPLICRRAAFPGFRTTSLTRGAATSTCSDSTTTVDPLIPFRTGVHRHIRQCSHSSSRRAMLSCIGGGGGGIAWGQQGAALKQSKLQDERVTLPVARSIGSSPAELFLPPHRLVHKYSVSADLSTPSSYATLTLSTFPSRQGPSRVRELIATGASSPPGEPGLAAGAEVAGTREDQDDQTVAPTCTVGQGVPVSPLI